MILSDRGNVNHSPSASVTNAESSESSPQFIANSSTPSSSSTWSKEEEKLLVQLWAEKHDQLESRESRKTWAWVAEKMSEVPGTSRSQHGVVFCSQILFSSATVASRTNFLSLANLKSDLSWTNPKLPSSATWP